MPVKISLRTIAFSGLLLGAVCWIRAQDAVAVPRQQSAGGFVPGQKRTAIEPAVVARGKTLFGINCQACHGQDLRGGDLGGPNLLRSQLALSDVDGELIVPVIQGSRQATGMPAIGLNLEDSKIVAAYLRSVVSTIGRQGTPPGKQKPLNVVIGNPADGRTYFALKCAHCHSAEGDLHGIGSRVLDAKTLQSMWVMGIAQTVSSEEPKVNTTVSVTSASGESVQGTLVRIDDFLITVMLSDGSSRTIRRNGDSPKVNTRDPRQAHTDLLSVYTDKDIHDVTAYLVTLK